MGFVLFFSGLMAGSVFGVAIMCCFQINKDGYYTTHKDTEEKDK